MLRKHLMYLPDDEPLAPGASLRDLGLDSMKAVDLVFDIEDTMGVELPDEALIAATFATPANLWAALCEARAEGSR